MNGERPVGCVLMASGFSRRFAGNKLMAPYCGRPLAAWALGAIPPALHEHTVVVTRYDAVAREAAARGLTVVQKPKETEHASGTIREGLRALGDGLGGCLFMVGDQPLLTRQSVQSLLEAFRREPDAIWALGHGGKKGNPVLFPAAFFAELMHLETEETGSAVIRRHPDSLRVLSIPDARELMDIDTLEDLAAL